MCPVLKNQILSDPDLSLLLLQTHRALEAAALKDLEKESTILMLFSELVARHASPSSLLHCSGESDWIESVSI